VRDRQGGIRLIPSVVEQDQIQSQTHWGKENLCIYCSDHLWRLLLLLQRSNCAITLHPRARQGCGIFCCLFWVLGFLTALIFEWEN
jgi:hypothetical protein